MGKKNYDPNGPQPVGNSKANYVKLVVCCFVFWMLLNGNATVKTLVMGIVASFLIAWISLPLLRVVNHDGTRAYSIMSIINARFFLYCFWLFKELIMANIDVAKSVWTKQMKIDPMVIRFTIHYDNPAAITLLSNSITLTPGTTNFFIKDDYIYEVHALTPGAADGIASGSMAIKVAEVFGEEPDFKFLGEV